MDGVTNSQASIDNWTQRPARQMLLDGRMELNFGLALLIGNLVNLYGHTRPQVPDPPWYWAVIPLWAAAGYLALIKGMKWLNERVIAPRAGYASFPDRTVQRRWMIASVLGLGAVMVTLGFFGKLPRLDWMGLGFAILLASFFFGLGIQFRLPHWLFFGVFVLALAGWLFRNGLGIEGGMWLAIWVGSAMVLTGAFRLWRFLHANPIPKDDTP